MDVTEVGRWWQEAEGEEGTLERPVFRSGSKEMRNTFGSSDVHAGWQRRLRHSSSTPVKWGARIG